MRKQYTHVSSIDRLGTAPDVKTPVERPMDKSSVVSSIIGVVCICIYIGAIVLAVIRIYVSVMDRQSIAKQEFFELVNTATEAASSSAVITTPSFQNAIKDSLARSKTLRGVIVSSGQFGDQPFEQEPGAAIAWDDGVLRFKTGLGFPSPENVFFERLQIGNLRDLSIKATYNYLDNAVIISVLKYSLVIIGGATAVALLAMGLQFLLLNGKKKTQAEAFSNIVDGKYRTDGNETENTPKDEDAEEPPTLRDTDIDEELFADPETIPPPDVEKKPPAKEPGWEIPVTLPPLPKVDVPPKPETPAPDRQNRPANSLCWESDTEDRLAVALRESTSAEKDLVVMLIELKADDNGEADESLYRIFVNEALDFFFFRDRLFERGQRGITVILPGLDLDGAFVKANDFHKRVSEKLGEKARVFIGLSAQSGRAVKADRLLIEASGALAKLAENPGSPIMAFRSDPKKYRDFMASQNKTTIQKPIAPQ
ncbi:MAG: hypothetical protein LBC46_06580 [Treponema sp.]|jgi:hypothetical protein|nr:hypothetical protein [Treponema sp.]